MAVIIVGGMIGLGKSSVAKIIGEELGSEVFYESVEDNPILPLFYTSTQEEIEKNRYPFLLQLYFLDTRFKAIKEALVHQHNVIDRGIYEDVYFCYMNMLYGEKMGENRISRLEYQVYSGLFENMMAELDELPKKAPDLMIYLKGSFETVMKRIQSRGRDFEQDSALIDYYKFIWEGYDDWVHKHYKASDVLVIDMDQIDVVNNPEDRDKVVEMVKEKLKLV